MSAVTPLYTSIVASMGAAGGVAFFVTLLAPSRTHLAVWLAILVFALAVGGAIWADMRDRETGA